MPPSPGAYGWHDRPRGDKKDASASAPQTLDPSPPRRKEQLKRLSVPHGRCRDPLSYADSVAFGVGAQVTGAHARLVPSAPPPPVAGFVINLSSLRSFISL